VSQRSLWIVCVGINVSRIVHLSERASDVLPNLGRRSLGFASKTNDLIGNYWWLRQFVMHFGNLLNVFFISF
jgi:hypothetical protein